jgi:L-ascorbate metabolism protein UlaG (beta-lactamase superfamily)
VEAIPPVDLLVISHSHLDHFDVPSLAHIAKTSRHCDVLCPKDESITYTLSRLGFTKVHPEEANRHFRLGKYELVTTPSHVTNVIEFGVVFKDETGTYWNQVDTVIAPNTVPEVLKVSGPIDLLFAMYASRNFNFFESRGTSFPHAMHQMNLNSVMAIRPKMAVPGAAGFRFAGAGMEWCNAFLCPMPRERFVADLGRVAPEIPTRFANPGDAFEIDREGVHFLPGVSEIAQTVEDDTDLLRFDTTATIPPLVDPNPSGVSLEKLERGVEESLAAFARFLNTALAKPGTDELVDEYRQLGVSYAVGVVFPE